MLRDDRESYDVDGLRGGDSHGGLVAGTLAAAAAAADHGAGWDFRNGQRLGGSRVEGGGLGDLTLLAVDLGAGGLSLKQLVLDTGTGGRESKHLQRRRCARQWQCCGWSW